MINDGGPAFAVSFPVRGSDVIKGMSLRDYFAAAALQGLLAQADPPAIDNLNGADFAAMAYEYADAMISERDGSTGSDDATEGAHDG